MRACGYPGAWACTCTYVHVALLIQYATRMCYVVTSFVAPQSPPHFSTLPHKRCDFRKKVTEHKMCVLIFSTNMYKTFLIVTRIQRDIVKYVKPSSRKAPLFFSDFNEIWIFSTVLRRKLKYQISSKSVQWEPSCSMRTDGQTDGWRS